MVESAPCSIDALTLTRYHMGVAKKATARINPSLAKIAVPIEGLHPDPRNARKHDDRSIAEIKKSLAEFGQQKPVVALDDGTVIAGNGTLAAALALGWSHLACVTFADAAKARAFAIADNRAAELSSWDVSELLSQLNELGEADLGFTSGEVQDLLDTQRNPFVTERADIMALKEHPRNYQKHPDDQLAHIMRSIELHGFYRNVVVARDYTILAGHGVVQAARKLGKARVPVIRLDLDPHEPRALRVITSDNEIGNLATTDDRALVELLKELVGSDGGLLGTGFDEAQLSAFDMVTRPPDAIQKTDAAAEWSAAGMPEHDPGRVTSESCYELVVHFVSLADAETFLQNTGITPTKKTGRCWSAPWPDGRREDLGADRWQPTDEDAGEDAEGDEAAVQ